MCRAASLRVNPTELLLDQLWHYSFVVSRKRAVERTCVAFAQPGQQSCSGDCPAQDFPGFHTQTSCSSCAMYVSQECEKKRSKNVFTSCIYALHRYISMKDKRESSGLRSISSTNQDYNRASYSSGDELPDPQIKLLHKVFNIFDENKDGQVTTKELHNLFTNLGLEMPHDQITSLLNHRFRENKGYVQFDEFLILIDSINADTTDDHEEAAVAQEDDLLNAFRLFDRNGDGLISPSELESILNVMGFEVGADDDDCVERMIRRVDMDGDGFVDFQEFKDMMTKDIWA